MWVVLTRCVQNSRRMCTLLHGPLAEMNCGEQQHRYYVLHWSHVQTENSNIVFTLGWRKKRVPHFLPFHFIFLWKLLRNLILYQFLTINMSPRCGTNSTLFGRGATLPKQSTILWPHLISDYPPGPCRAQHSHRPQQGLQDLRLWTIAEPQRHRQRDVRTEDKGQDKNNYFIFWALFVPLFMLYSENNNLCWPLKPQSENEIRQGRAVFTLSVKLLFA